MHDKLVNIKLELENLFNSQEFKNIDSYKKPMNFFEISGITHREVIHSKIIANLLTPSYRHGIGDTFLKCFLDFVAPKISANKNEGKVIKSLYKYPVDIGTEVGNIDIMLNFTHDEKYAIGIENKINHIETKNQLSTYQDKMISMFPEHKKYLLFLTVNGREATTHDRRNKEVQVFSLSYSDLLKILMITMKNSNNFSVIIEQLIFNIKENLVNEPMIKELCLEAYRKYPYAYKKLIENLPDLSLISEKIKQEVKDKHDLKCWVYTNKYNNITSEIGFLRQDEGWGKGVHIKAFLDENMNIQVFPAISRDVHKNKSDIINKLSYQPCFLEKMEDWYWMMLDERLKTEIPINNMFDNYTANKVSDAVSLLFTEVDKKLLSFGE